MYLQVNEIFMSIQGEGYWSGAPVIFLRLQGCNLRCSWCDTDKAQDIKGGISVPVSVLAERIRSLPPTAVVVTGGEPLLQSAALVQLQALCTHKSFMLETNGTLLLQGTEFLWVVVSPKPPSYTIHRSLRPSEIKVIVEGAKTFPIALELAEEHPQAMMSLQPVDNRLDIARECVDFLVHLHSQESRWRLSMQVHKFLGVR
jgi:7-carboxy-7-deazaguanine synthase